MSTAIEPILSLDDPRFEQEPWNYRFIVSHEDGIFTATTFEMPNLSATARSSHEALTLLAGHMTDAIPFMLEPTSRSRPPSQYERGRFMPVHRRLFHKGALRDIDFYSLTAWEPHSGWYRMEHTDPERDETPTPVETAIDAADVALWLYPEDDDSQLVQIHNEVYAVGTTWPGERRWPREAIKQALDMPEKSGQESSNFVTVFKGARGTATCEGEHHPTPNLLRIKQYDPAPGTTRLDFWHALRQYIIDNTSPPKMCQDCELRPSAYDYRPTGPRGHGPDAFMRLCADCTVQTLLEDMDPNEPKPQLTRI